MSSSIFGHPLNPCAAINKETPPGAMLLGALVRVTRFERAISTSQMWRGTSSATPGYSVFDIIPRWGRKSKIFLSVVIPVVKAAFQSGLLTRRNPANARVTRLSGLPLLSSWIASGPLPKQARYQQRYTRLLSCFIRLGVFSQSNRAKSFSWWKGGTYPALPFYRFLLRSQEKYAPHAAS